MTLPPPVLPGLQTGNSGTRRRAPVSDHPGASLAAAETHAVCVMDAGGKIAAEFTIEHSADGIATLIRRLARYGLPLRHTGRHRAPERPPGQP